MLTGRRVLMLLALVAIVSVGAYVVDWRGVLSTIARASLPIVLLTAASTFVSTLIKGVRWWLFLRRSTRLTVGHVVRLTIAGTGVNSLLFANAGDVMRVGMAASDSGVPVPTILGSLASDKVVEVLAFITMAIIATVAQPAAVIPGGVAWLSAASIMALVLLVLAGRMSHRARAFLAETRQRLRGPDAPIGYLISLVSWPAQIAAYSLGALAVGVHVPIRGSVAAVVAVNVAGVLRSTPGNVGVFQVMYALAVAPYGVGRTTAIAAALLIQSVQMLSAVLAGLIATVRRGPSSWSPS